MSQINTSQYNFYTLNQLNTPKPLPPLDFVSKLIQICYMPNTLFESQQRNLYDRKNHILYINNYEAYARALKQKCTRTVSSFEKQLKMIGFKKKIIKQKYLSPAKPLISQILQQNHQQSKLYTKIYAQFAENHEQVSVEQQKNNRNLSQTLQQQRNYNKKYMFIWRTNRTALIQKQLITFQQSLSDRIQKALLLKQEIEKRKKQIDSHLETIIIKNLISQNLFQIKSQSKNHNTIDKFLNKSINQLKGFVNNTQIQSKNLISSISTHASNQLQLYRTLIFKENKVHNQSDIEQQ